MGRGIVSGLALLCLVAPIPAAGQTSDPDMARETERPRLSANFTLQNLYPRLEDERRLKRAFDGVLGRFSPTYDGVTTFGDQRDDALIWAPQAGLGWDATPRLSLSVQAGYTAGPVRSGGTELIYPLIPFRWDLELKRSGVFIAAGVDVYPWGMPELRDYASARERLKAARPVVGVRASLARNTFSGTLRAGPRALGGFMRLSVDESWTFVNLYPSLGVEVPIDRRNTFALTGNYNWPTKQKRNLEGPGVTLTWKRYFGPSQR